MKNPTALSNSLLQACLASLYTSLGLLVLNMAGVARGQDENTAFFEAKIRPVLAAQCYECHSAAAKAVKGGLRLDTRAGLAKGGDGGPVVVPGKPEESPLYLAIKYQGDAENMPPKGKLPDPVIADFKTWISTGAHDPRTDSAQTPVETAGSTWRQTFDKRRNWWSFRPMQAVSVPKSQLQNPIDRFIEAGLKSKQLQLSAEADRETLARRLYFDLLGLPPTEAELDAYLNDKSADAYEKLVGRLLDSPHFGERAARRWMDLTHYSETVGSEQDALIPYAWAYRDYLIRAFNADLPYKDLLKEHLAGDLIQPARRDPKTGLAQSPVGTSWMRFVEFYHSPVDVKNEEITVIDNQVDTFGKTFLGLTLACARCHDHKFDPIGTDDFYRLYGTFRTARATVHSLADLNQVKPHAVDANTKKAALKKQWQEVWLAELAKLNQLVADAFEPGRPVDPRITEFLKISVASPMKWGFALAEAQKALAARTDFGTAFENARKRVAAQGEPTWRKPRTKQTLLADFSDPRSFPAGWSLQSPFNASHVKAGSFRPGWKPDQLVEFIRPSGFYSDDISDKLNATLRSPEFTLTGGTYSVLVSGTSNARLRLVVDNFQGVDILFGGVTPVLNNPRMAWVKLPVRDIWKGRQAYLELVTRDEMPSTGVIRDLNQLPRDGRSSIGIKYVVHHDNNDPVHEGSVAFTDISGKEAIVPANLAYQFTRNVADALIAFGYNQLTDSQAALLQDLLDSRLLSNTTTPGSALSQAINAFRAAEEKIDLSARSVGVAENAFSNTIQQTFIRGDHKRLGPATPPGLIQLLNPSLTPFPAGPPARLQLAEQLTLADNPLVWRVIANRLWSWYFGQGIFASVDNVGHMGEAPAHPELLDWLALEFQQNGGSIKNLTRLIVTSQTYKQSSKPSPAANQADPANRLLSHACVKRLDAESLRDALITASGRLDRTLFGLPLPTPQPPGLTDDKKPVSGPVDGFGRRSLYLNVRKNFPVEFLEVFDRPRPTLTVGKRNISNQPAQALALMNDPFISGEAQRLGTLLAGDKTTDDQAKLNSLYRRLLGRQPTAAELQRALAWLKAGNTWPDLVQALFQTKEFLFLD